MAYKTAGIPAIASELCKFQFDSSCCIVVVAVDTDPDLDTQNITAAIAVLTVSSAKATLCLLVLGEMYRLDKRGCNVYWSASKTM